MKPSDRIGKEIDEQISRMRFNAMPQELVIGRIIMFTSLILDEMDERLTALESRHTVAE